MGLDLTKQIDSDLNIFGTDWFLSNNTCFVKREIQIVQRFILNTANTGPGSCFSATDQPFEPL